MVASTTTVAATTITAVATAKSAPHRGLECPGCGCSRSRVLYTRSAWGGRLLRRRACLHCGRRVTTYEQSAATAR